MGVIYKALDTHLNRTVAIAVYDITEADGRPSRTSGV